jgi:hypothetical protein
MLDFNKPMYPKHRQELVQVLMDLQEKIDFRVSARGWCYQMETDGYINKGQFDKVENAINKCRIEGLLPINFVADDDARAFTGLKKPSEETIKGLLRRMLDDVLHGYWHFTEDWLEGEQYYIQVLVEKIDLRTMFAAVCKDYHIPIANARGWSSLLQRAEIARRFADAELRGLQCVLIYFGDFDPDGLRISDNLLKNFRDISAVVWNDGGEGYDPENLIIERVGLDYDFIIQNNYSWINNLKTGRGGDLANPGHENHYKSYVQNWLKTIGERKCESNAMITTPVVARQLLRDAVEKYLGTDAVARFQAKRQEIQDLYQTELEQLGVVEIDALEEAISQLDDEIENE